MDKERLIKFLNLSKSSNDSEALSATRMANVLLEEENSNWEEVIKISDALEAVIKRNNNEYVVLHRDLMKKRMYTQELKNNIRGLKQLLKYFIIFIIILIIAIILK